MRVAARHRRVDDEVGRFEASRNGAVVTDIITESRFYPVRGMGTTEAGIVARIQGDLYVTIGERVEGRGWPVHIYIYPLAVWLWIGSVILALGGFLSILDRGRRVAEDEIAGLTDELIKKHLTV